MISIVIVSYNYERYLPLAVESALMQTLACEVVVVDDGSTDGSLAALAPYRNKIKVIEKQNGGHASAIYAGFLNSTGESIIFLDSDDLLDERCAETAARHMAPGVAKVQYQLRVVGPSGEDHKVSFPHYPPEISPAFIRHASITTGAYPRPVTSGNMFARDYLAKVLPITDLLFKNDIEPFINGLAPLYGAVASVPTVLGSYRVHGKNYWAREDQSSSWSRYLQHRFDAHEIFEAHAERLGVQVAPDALFNSLSHLECRILSLRFTPDRHPAPEDRRGSLLVRGLRTAWHSPDLTTTGRVLWSGYLALIAFYPLRLLRRAMPSFRSAGKRASWARLLLTVSRLRVRGRRGSV